MLTDESIDIPLRSFHMELNWDSREHKSMSLRREAPSFVLDGNISEYVGEANFQFV